MTKSIAPLLQSDAWQALAIDGEQLKSRHLHDLFAEDPQRVEALSAQGAGLLLDISKQRLTPNTLELLAGVADSCDLAGWRARLFAGDKVNMTEGRAAMHWRLRAREDDAPEVAAELARMALMVERILLGHWRGYLGERITDVVNIGVGGSDLGPLMAASALHQFQPPAGQRPQLHFVSSMDGSQLDSLLEQLNPRTTLFIVSSKSFTTVDTLTNAQTARTWLERGCGGPSPALMRCHFIAVSASPAKVREWGIGDDNCLNFWDWVGGRFSLWSAIGLPIALTIGMDGFRQFLAGARAMDEHFQAAPWKQNLPVMLALVDVWNCNILGIPARAVLPYDGRLNYLPGYLEQLEMESNGKSIDRHGQPVAYDTCPVIWGEVGPNAQHAFYQLLHQGTRPVACEFLVTARRYPEAPINDHQRALETQHGLALANCLAQSRLLAFGDHALSTASDNPHKRYRGNQPSTTIMMPSVTPASLGALIALYEHKVFAEAVIWGINPFDQWGVEMGKVLAEGMQARLAGKPVGDPLDASTEALLRYLIAER